MNELQLLHKIDGLTCCPYCREQITENDLNHVVDLAWSYENEQESHNECPECGEEVNELDLVTFEEWEELI